MSIAPFRIERLGGSIEMFAGGLHAASVDDEKHHPQPPPLKRRGFPDSPTPLQRRGPGGGGVSRETLLKRAAQMRTNPTEPERRLWMQLRTRRFFDHKFRRQAVIGMRIVDLFCPAKGLVIELDGDTHDRDLDLRRDQRMLCDYGFRCVRFTNAQVMSNIDGVLIAVQHALEAQPDRWVGAGHHPPAPSSEEEGET